MWGGEVDEGWMWRGGCGEVDVERWMWGGCGVERCMWFGGIGRRIHKNPILRRMPLTDLSLDELLTILVTWME